MGPGFDSRKVQGLYREVARENHPTHLCDRTPLVSAAQALKSLSFALLVGSEMLGADWLVTSI